AGGGRGGGPGSDGALRGGRGGIAGVRLVNARRDREVEDAEVERVLVRDRVVDGGDHVADVALAAAVEHLLDQERRAGRDAAPAAARIVAAAGQNPGDVRAVAVVVVRGRLERDEIDEPRDAVRTEIVVPRGDAGGDQRNA